MGDQTALDCQYLKGLTSCNSYRYMFALGHLHRAVLGLKFSIRRTDSGAINEVVVLRVGRGHVNAHLWDLSHFLISSVYQSDVGVEKDVPIFY